MSHEATIIVVVGAFVMLVALVWFFGGKKPTRPY